MASNKSRLLRQPIGFKILGSARPLIHDALPDETLTAVLKQLIKKYKTVFTDANKIEAPEDLLCSIHIPTARILRNNGRLREQLQHLSSSEPAVAGGGEGETGEVVWLCTQQDFDKFRATLHEQLGASHFRGQRVEPPAYINLLSHEQLSEFVSLNVGGVRASPTRVPKLDSRNRSSTKKEGISKNSVKQTPTTSSSATAPSGPASDNDASPTSLEQTLRAESSDLTSETDLPPPPPPFTPPPMPTTASGNSPAKNKSSSSKSRHSPTVSSPPATSTAATGAVANNLSRRSSTKQVQNRPLVGYDKPEVDVLLQIAEKRRVEAEKEMARRRILAEEEEVKRRIEQAAKDERLAQKTRLLDAVAREEAALEAARAAQGELAREAARLAGLEQLVAQLESEKQSLTDILTETEAHAIALARANEQIRIEEEAKRLDAQRRAEEDQRRFSEAAALQEEKRVASAAAAAAEAAASEERRRAAEIAAALALKEEQRRRAAKEIAAAELTAAQIAAAQIAATQIAAAQVAAHEFATAQIAAAQIAAEVAAELAVAEAAAAAAQAISEMPQSPPPPPPGSLPPTQSASSTASILPANPRRSSVKVLAPKRRTGLKEAVRRVVTMLAIRSNSFHEVATVDSTNEDETTSVSQSPESTSSPSSPPSPTKKAEALHIAAALSQDSAKFVAPKRRSTLKTPVRGGNRPDQDQDQDQNIPTHEGSELKAHQQEAWENGAKDQSSVSGPNVNHKPFVQSTTQSPNAQSQPDNATVLAKGRPRSDSSSPTTRRSIPGNQGLGKPFAFGLGGGVLPAAPAPAPASAQTQTLNRSQNAPSKVAATNKPASDQAHSKPLSTFRIQTDLDLVIEANPTPSASPVAVKSSPASSEKEVANQNYTTLVAGGPQARTSPTISPVRIRSDFSPGRARTSSGALEARLGETRSMLLMLNPGALDPNVTTHEASADSVQVDATNDQLFLDVHVDTLAPLAMPLASANRSSPLPNLSLDRMEREAQGLQAMLGKRPGLMLPILGPNGSGNSVEAAATPTSLRDVEIQPAPKSGVLSPETPDRQASAYVEMPTPSLSEDLSTRSYLTVLPYPSRLLPEPTPLSLRKSGSRLSLSDLQLPMQSTPHGPSLSQLLPLELYYLPFIRTQSSFRAFSGVVRINASTAVSDCSSWISTLWVVFQLYGNQGEGPVCKTITSQQVKRALKEAGYNDDVCTRLLLTSMLVLSKVQATQKLSGSGQQQGNVAMSKTGTVSSSKKTANATDKRMNFREFIILMNSFADSMKELEQKAGSAGGSSRLRADSTTSGLSLDDSNPVDMSGLFINSTEDGDSTRNKTQAAFRDGLARRLRAQYATNPIKNSASFACETVLERSVLCVSGLLSYTHDTKPSLHHESTLFSIAALESVRALWERNAALFLQLYNYYSKTLEPRTPAQSAIVSEKAEMENQQLHPIFSRLHIWNTLLNAQSGQSVPVLSFDQLLTLLKDFGVFPALIDIQTLYRGIKGVKLWEWSLADSIQAASAGSSSGLVDDVNSSGAGGVGSLDVPLFRASSNNNTTNISNISNISTSNINTSVSITSDRALESSEPVVLEVHDPLGVSATSRSLSLTLGGLIELLTRLAVQDAQLDSSPRAAVSNLLRLMSESGGRTKLLQSNRKSKALRSFAYDTK